MKKRGFTLVELLAVIVLISMIMVLAFTTILHKSKTLNQLSDKELNEVIISSAKSYVNSNELLKKQLNLTNYLVVEYSDLEKYGYLNEGIKNLENQNNIDYSQYRVCINRDTSLNYNYEITSEKCKVNDETIIYVLKDKCKKYLKANSSVNDQLQQNGSLTISYSTLSSFDNSIANMYVENKNISSYAVCLKYENAYTYYDVSTTGLCE